MSMKCPFINSFNSKVRKLSYSQEYILLSDLCCKIKERKKKNEKVVHPLATKLTFLHFFRYCLQFQEENSIFQQCFRNVYFETFYHSERQNNAELNSVTQTTQYFSLCMSTSVSLSQRSQYSVESLESVLRTTNI